jgi:hypothetical protein
MVRTLANRTSSKSCIANSRQNITAASMMFRFSGAAMVRPSGALRTEMAGVMASP